MDNLRLWHKFLEIIKPQISADNYKGWFLKTSIKEASDDKIILSVPSAFVKETLYQRYLSLIENTFEQLTGKKLKVEFIIRQLPQKETPAEDLFQPVQTQVSVLNPRYTMENFVVGLTNNLAYAAAQAVVQNPGLSYNPLYIYGGTGVGKTHLMLAIGNAIFKKKPHSKINYCPSDKFLNDYVEAIQTHKMTDFRRKYRQADILLIDDIQFFSGREGTQEEFFHTFNELQGKNSQMVFTSDRPPQEIAKIEDRLKSRFAGGLMVDIQPPDFDTRVAILKAKCLERGESLPEDSVRLLASSFDSNIRELEGSLMQILQLLKLKNLPPTAENISINLGQQPQRPINADPKKILTEICGYFNLSAKDLTGPKRQKELVLPRHIAMFILAEDLKLTVERIGQLLGGRDHTTVMHGRDKIKKLIVTDREIQRVFTEVKGRLMQ
ncbi:hypothetical protein A3C26_02710 [Candidatus Daviesbacteria bacterium RIFCSPHIGHO2_02_FULL_39_12]|uniref:Chromosomal replication initiator protein DnaA n=2 Tax=Candidatus Daviesiibacteriota TaxID=1752718 RepID=A0A1F5J8F5_9BACT|nr:MAG: hypothetical protein A3C26_02710 [Candidatus Daviesbacteria bacterium RIFCSPHIGHO2_02_FULL_39_12]OGE72538.1 MAG: hypothetical protein A3H40_00350 [Candidatus Daviesbacteria bacterium RIFCSPLOWO2_02_FULL_38_15]